MKGARTRNPFGVMDVPDPNDNEVRMLAAHTQLVGAADDDNADDWGLGEQSAQPGGIEGQWLSRWNGGADPTIPGDAVDKWKQGRAQLRTASGRVYLLFNWHDGARRGLIDAERVGPTGLIGKYINLTNPAITRPWIGLIVSHSRIDGRWTGGRLDFRR